jgi:hypothetical protein
MKMAQKMAFLTQNATFMTKIGIEFSGGRDLTLHQSLRLGK